MFEGEGVLVGDYRKGQSAAVDPSENVTLWVLPSPVARILCRMIIFGKPLETRLAEQFYGTQAAVVHRTLLGACDGKPLKSTKLGALTNAALAGQCCPSIQEMRHVREHFSTELMLEDPERLQKRAAKELQVHGHAIAAISSNHDPTTARAVYAGVFEKHR